MAWKRPPSALQTRYFAALPADARVQRRQMFGMPCAFVNGNMFSGLFEDRVHVRLPPARKADLLAMPGASPLAPMGRVMRDYACLPPATVDNDGALSAWLREALDHAAALPPKVQRVKRISPRENANK